ncbi:MAG: hydrogenase maturation protease [Bacteroidetes bacterium]|nr:hydrogenase maturation protease [Bacteroidota bacterium]
MNKKKILIHGIGNEIVTDDGIGPKLVKRLQENLSGVDVDFETAFLGGLEVLEFIQGYQTVIFIDAIRTLGGIPGTVYKLSPENFNSTIHLSSVHDVSFLTAVDLGKKLGLEMPEFIHIVAVEIVEDRVFDDNFSPLIQEKYEEIYREVKEITEEIIAN